ncbi:MAG TPA: 6-pyruvoyl-tetrahydropterin synthase-related protein [Pyrinomonadaceae bacterium]|jgi:hypothetical protein|nr:6-pyruvoyl-tetrahydropterin synthase-related protein [Pyrinomonadaceae bacterium]
MKGPKRTYALAVAAAGLILSLPSWLLGFPPAGDDSVTHAVWFAHFSRQFWAGDLYPRWLADMNAGLGSPVFYYYAPLPYYFASLLSPLFPAGVSTLRPLGVAAALAVVLSGLAAYLWLRKLSDEKSAAAGAIIYVLAPYHLAFDLYMRDAYAEVFAFVWLPLVMHHARGVREGQRRAAVWLSASYALLVLTHLPTTLIFSAVPVAYVFFTAERGRRMRASFATLLALALGAGVAAIYLVPALAMRAYVSMGEMGGSLYYERFVPSVTANPLRHEGKILWCVLTTLGLVVCAHLASRGRSVGGRDERKFWLACACAGVFLLTAASDTVWRLAPALQSVQFPWRFNVVLCVAAAAVVALSLHASKAPGGRARRVAVGVACAMLAGWVGLTSLCLWQAYGNRELAREYARGVGVWVALGRDVPEYRPASALSNSPAYFERLAGRFCREGDEMARACVVEGGGTLSVERWQPRLIALRVASDGGVVIDARQFYFPGWVALLDGRPLPLRPSSPDGLLRFSVPAGAHRVGLTLTRTAPETAGRIVSLFSLALLLAWALRAGKGAGAARGGGGDSHAR